MAKVGVFNYKTHIFDVELDETGHLISIGEILNRDLMPFCLMNHYDLKNVKAWMEKRMIPENRIGLEYIRRLFPTSSLANPHCMFSLTDQYWFRWSTRETWEKGNFFKNSYDTDYGRMFFSASTVDDKNLKHECPDMTTNGVLPKRWVRDDKTGNSYLIKSGNRDAHQDPISEVMSSMTLERLKIIPFVRYEFVIDGMSFCTKCENFIHVNEEFVPASHIYHMEPRKDDEDKKLHLIRMIKKYIPDLENVEDYLDRMATADYCISNNDRHLSNFGFIRDTTTGKIKKFAPLFDSGSAFFGNGNKDGKSSRLFTDEQIEAAMTRVFGDMNGKLSSRIKEDELIELIDVYPLLTAADKERIKKQITSVYSDIRNRIRTKIRTRVEDILEI